ncbi:uberolysin/carnocyclin family circular bacteriocin [Staphylococcus simulans]
MNITKSNNKLLITFGIVFTALTAFVLFNGMTEMNLLVGKLGVEVSKANWIVSAIESGSTVMQVVGMLGAGTGVGMAVAGAAGVLKYLIKKRLKSAAISF